MIYLDALHYHAKWLSEEIGLLVAAQQSKEDSFGKGIECLISGGISALFGGIASENLSENLSVSSTTLFWASTTLLGAGIGSVAGVVGYKTKETIQEKITKKRRIMIGGEIYNQLMEFGQNF